MTADTPMPQTPGMVQLSLGITLSESANFANYHTAAENQLAARALQAFAAGQGEGNLLIWGKPGAGLTHLLQACCHAAGEQGLDALYLPLADLAGYSPEGVCEGLERVPLVCLDDLDAIGGNRCWEQTLFHLFNRLRDNGHRLLLASHATPAALPVTLPDLKSRFLGSVIYQIHSLDDADKAAALQMRAKARGLDMPDDVARYLLARAPRSTADLFDLLNRLDEASLQQQRRLTIPFIKAELGY